MLVSHPRSKDLVDLVLYIFGWGLHALQIDISETVEIEAQESPASAQNVASKPAVILLWGWDAVLNFKKSK